MSNSTKTSATSQIETKIRVATDAVVQQIAATDDDIAGAVVGRNTNVHLVINSSFLYRDKQSVKTIQSPRRLVARLAASGKRVRSDDLLIVDDLMIRGHYKALFQQGAFTFTPLASAISQELASVGDLLFILIGTAKGLRPHTQTVKGTAIKELRLIPSQSGADVQQTEPGIYGIRRLLPLEELLARISQDLDQQGGTSAEDRRAIAEAYDTMLDAAITDVVVPTGKVLNPTDTILGQIVAALRNQTSDYRTAVTALRNASDDKQVINEILRIAYNFSTDVLPLISLFRSVCDLKPLMFWSTVKEQWGLYRAFASLPWAALGRKESVEEYQSIVSQARSYAFHHVLPFDSTVEVDLTDLDVRAQTIRLFVPFGQKQGRGVHLKDQKLADVLAEFSRAKQRPVSTIFWNANLNVMQEACHLAQQVLETLVLVHEARQR